MRTSAKVTVESIAATPKGKFGGDGKKLAATPKNTVEYIGSYLQQVSGKVVDRDAMIRNIIITSRKEDNFNIMKQELEDVAGYGTFRNGLLAHLNHSAKDYKVTWSNGKHGVNVAK